MDEALAEQSSPVLSPFSGPHRWAELAPA